MSKTTPTKDSIRAEFEELVEKDSFWSKFVGSQFVSMLTLFITQIVYRCFQYADAALAEGFISTATRRSSILAAAETNSYVGTKPTPSSGMVEITATSEDAPAVIPKNTPLISDDQYPYMTMDVCRLVDGTGTVEVAQLEIQEVTYTVTAAKEFLEVVLSKALTAVCYKLEVFVTTDGKTTQWSSSTMFRLAGSKSQVYVEFYKPSEQLGVRFGDGLIGQIPPEGSTITLKVWCTNGDITLVAGQNLTPVDSAANLANLISVKTTTPITAGTDAETTEITRNRAQ
ncbi:TPA: bleomycin hydrolase, partial [Escherichia coli]